MYVSLGNIVRSYNKNVVFVFNVWCNKSIGITNYYIVVFLLSNNRHWIGYLVSSYKTNFLP